MIFRTGEPVGVVGTGVKIYNWKLQGVGVSLGNSVFVSYRNSLSTIRHEYGHTRQSVVLGPLYLVLGVIGALWFILYKLFLKKLGVDYKWFFMESMADRLGANAEVWFHNHIPITSVRANPNIFKYHYYI